MARGELVFASLGGVGEIGMNLSLYGVGDERRREWLIVDCGVSFAAEEHLPGVDLHSSGHPPSDRGAAQHRRPRAHPCPRGPHRRAHRPVAAAQGADLCHAVHGGSVRSTPPVRAGRAEDPGERGAARRQSDARSVRDRLHQRRSFDSGIECAGDPHAARHRAAHRRLEDRSDAGDRRADRRGAACGARRRGRAGARRRFHQCDPRRPLALGSGGGKDACRADPLRAGPRRRHDIRFPCRTPARGGRCGARRRPRGGGGRPRHGARGPGCARDWLLRRRAGVSRRRDLRLSAAGQGAGAVHRQPGRAARRAGAHRRERAS